MSGSVRSALVSPRDWLLLRSVQAWWLERQLHVGRRGGVDACRVVDWILKVRLRCVKLFLQWEGSGCRSMYTLVRHCLLRI